MFINKGWTIGSIIRNVRKEEGITLLQLSYGLCSVAKMNRIETEDRNEDILLVSRILQRLGINPDKFELYSGKDEFEQLEERRLILTWIRDGAFELAEEGLKTYKDKWHDYINKNSLQTQFVQTVLGHLAMHRKNFQNSILLFEHAISISIPNWNKDTIFKCLLSEDELKLLSSLSDAYEFSDKIQEAFSLRTKIIEYIKQSHITKDLEPQLYTEVICKVVTSLIEQGNPNIALELCDRGLETLTTTKRMYRWPDILRLKGECLEELYKCDKLKYAEIIELYQKSYCIYELFGDTENAYKIKNYLKEKYAWELIW